MAWKARAGASLSLAFDLDLMLQPADTAPPMLASTNKTAIPNTFVFFIKESSSFGYRCCDHHHTKGLNSKTWVAHRNRCSRESLGCNSIDSPEALVDRSRYLLGRGRNCRTGKSSCRHSTHNRSGCNHHFARGLSPKKRPARIRAPTKP